MAKPELKLSIIEAVNLFDPKVYWKKYNRFAAYCVVKFQDSTKKTREAVAEEKKSSQGLPPWNESLAFSVDTKKLSRETCILIEVWQKKWREYWESNKDVVLGRVQIPVSSIVDGQFYDNWIALEKGGRLHITLERHGLNPILGPFQPSSQVNPNSPQPKQQPTKQAQPQQVPQQPPVNYSPPLYQQPTHYAPPPYYVTQMASYPPVYASAPPSAPSQQPPSFPNMQPMAQSLPPTQTPPAKGPSVPLKVSLPEHLLPITVVASTEQAKQQVPSTILNDYFKFCGTIITIHKDPSIPLAFIAFSKDYEADTAMFLDNGNVCGGPIKVFKYKDIGSHIVEQQRVSVEKAAKNFIEQASTGLQKQQSSPVSNEDSDISYPMIDGIDATGTSVFVKNLSNQATVEGITDFFSYCGNVKGVTMYREEDCQSAVVHFETKDSATTAILLSSAIIFDRAIQVKVLTPEKEKELVQKKVVSTGDAKESKMTDNNSGNSKMSVVSSLAAAGYNVGSQAVKKAKLYDAQHLHLGETWQEYKNKLYEIDNKYEISKKAQQGIDKAKSGAKSAWAYLKSEASKVQQPSSPTTSSTSSPQPSK